MRLYPRDLRNHTLVLLDRDGLEIARVFGDAWLPFASAMAHGYDLEDAAQRGEPDPWSPEFQSDKEWEALRRMCAWVAIRAAFESVIPGPHQTTRCTTTEAADEIDRLRTENARLLRLMALAHAIMRQTGWQLATASIDPEADGVLELAAAEVESAFADALAHKAENGGER